jgi:hypothetical protein
MWFAVAFPFVSFGVERLIEQHLWLDGNRYWLAFSKSLWINFLGGYGFSMMLTHEYFNKCIEHGTLISLTTFAECMSTPNAGQTWFRYFPLTLVVWLILHTVTYLLPPVYYVLMAASLSIVLAYFLTIIHRP